MKNKSLLFYIVILSFLPGVTQGTTDTDSFNPIFIDTIRNLKITDPLNLKSCTSIPSNKIIVNPMLRFIKNNSSLLNDGSPDKCVEKNLKSIEVDGDSAGWKSVGPYAEIIHGAVSITSLDSIIFAIVDGLGLFQSSDNGISWELINNSPLIQSSGIIYSFKSKLIIVNPDGLYYSADNGLTWNLSTTNETNLITTFTSNDTALFAGTTNGKVIYFNEIELPGKVLEMSNKGQVKRLIFDKDNLFFLTSSGIYKLTDNFLKLDTVHLAEWIVDFAVLDSAIFYNTYYYVYMSKDTGKTWQALFSSKFDIFIRPLSAKDSLLLIPDRFECIILNTNNFKFAVFNYAEPNLCYIFENDTVNYLMISTSQGLFTSSDGGLNWNTIDPNFFKTILKKEVFSVCSVDSLIMAGAPYSIPWRSFEILDNSLFRTNIKDFKWNLVQTGYTSPYLENHISKSFLFNENTDSARVFMSFFKDGPFVSKDTGKIWHRIPDGLIYNSEHQLAYEVNCFAELNSKIFAGTDSGICYFNESDESWIFSNNGIPLNEHILSLYPEGNIIYAGTENSGLYFSNDSGYNWICKAPDLRKVISITTNDTVIFIACEQDGVYVSSKENFMFEHCNNGLDNLNSKILYNLDNVILLGTTGSGIYRLRTDKLSWKKLYSGSEFNNVSSIADNDSLLFLGTDQGVWYNNKCNFLIETNLTTTICEGDSVSFGDQTIHDAGEYVKIYPGLSGCDSTVTQTVIVGLKYIDTISVTICQGDTYQFGNQTLSAPGSYTQVFNSTFGCDSTVKLNLEIQSIDVEVSQDQTVLCANKSTGLYQWYDCNLKRIIPGWGTRCIFGEYGGNYAVIVRENLCADTSQCFSIYYYNVKDDAANSDLSVYPNPTSDKLNIIVSYSSEMIINDILGRSIQTIKLTEGLNLIDLSAFPDGIYFLNFMEKNINKRVKIIKSGK